jgi:ADP-heptose:LPS heptosyltransferase
VNDLNRNTNRKVLFLRPGKLGDLIVATPFFKLIKTHEPSIRIVIACSPQNSIIVQNNPFVDEIRVVNFHSLMDVIRLILWIRKQHISHLIDLIPGFSRTSTLIARFVRSKVTTIAGMHKHAGQRYFTIVTNAEGIHIIERNRVLIETALKLKFTNDLRTELFPVEKHIQNVTTLLANCDHRFPLVGINCSAGEIERQWGKEKYIELIRRFLQSYQNITLVLFAVSEQVAWVRGLFSNANRIVIVAGYDLLTVTAMISRLAIFITPDTSLIHIASGYKLPIVGLYCINGENLVRWRAYNCISMELIADATHNVNELTVDAVVNAADELLGQRRLGTA